MGAQDFGQLVRQAMKDKGLSQGRLGHLITRDDGPFYDASQVRLILQGKRRITHDLVEDLIKVLDLDAADAWSAAGLWPPDLTADSYREVRQARTTHPVARRRVRPAEDAETVTTQPKPLRMPYTVGAGRRAGILPFPALRWAA